MTGSDISAQIYDAALMICNVANIPAGTTVTYQWTRADMSPISAPFTTASSLFFPFVGVSDAGVYICEVTISDSLNDPYVIPQSGSVSITLTVTSKCGTFSTPCKYI